MLTKLNITNFALISEASLDFKDGLVIFSGETGAGKSVLINAISFLIGERADKTFVRSGSSFALVQGVFVLDEKSIQVCQEFGIETDSNLILSRKLFADGRSETRANGVLLSVSMLRQISKFLMDIYGQHQHQCLLDENLHIDFVDSFDFPSEILELKQIVLKIAELNQKLKIFGGDEGVLAREKDILQFELDEIHAINPSVQEDEMLLDKKKKFSNVQRVAESVKGAQSAFSCDEFSVSNALCFALKSLKNISAEDGDIDEICKRIDSVRIEFDDITQTLSSLLESYDFSAEEFEEMETRLESFAKLKRKYGGNMESVLDYMHQAEEKLKFLQNSEQEIEKIVLEKQNLTQKANELCEKISEKRKKNATLIEKQILSELETLGMKGCKFEIEFEQLETFGENGFDKLRFLFSANQGQPLKPLAKIISGGEMSRFMLAFKAVFGKKNGVSSMVFDEIDSGIGGETGFAVGLKLLELSKNAQVFVVTHLASIGAMANQHFCITKQTEGQNTFTKLKELSEDEQLGEIARLAGGFQGQVATEYAKQLKSRGCQAKS